MEREREGGTGLISRSDLYLQYLSVIMLGLIVTRSVLVPTSAEYLSLMGGMLHLQRRKHEELKLNEMYCDLTVTVAKHY